MKTCKKALAILLALCMMMSAMMITSSAEDAALVGFRVDSGKVLATASGDAETVTQLELTISADNDAVFSKVSSAEITICDFDYMIARSFLAGALAADNLEDWDAFAEVQVDEIVASATIAKAKAVSCTDNKLVLDVYSTGGAKGAKLVDFQIEIMNEVLPFDQLAFVFPEGVLQTTAGTKSEKSYEEVYVDGLAPKTVPLPSIVNEIVEDIFTENYYGIITKALPLLPFLIFVVPALVSMAVSRLDDAYAVYGLKVSDLLPDAMKVLKKFIPVLVNMLISEIF